jgi:hypothetical protein
MSSSVNLAAFAPSRCGHGHYIGLHGRSQVSWSPCECAGALAGDDPRRGHIQVKCMACEAEGRRVVYYDPPHSEDAGQPRP